MGHSGEGQDPRELAGERRGQDDAQITGARPFWVTCHSTGN